MRTDLFVSPYWHTRSASGTLTRICEYEKEKTYRPTVVVPIIDYAGRPLIVRHNTPEGNWGLVQGHIEPYDVHPVAAGLREAWEEALVTEGKIAAVFPYLGEEDVEFPQRSWQTGYSQGGYYVFVGIKLRPGADVSVMPPPGQQQALLERRWCSTLDQAITFLREQPGNEWVSPATKKKVEQVLIPALESVFAPWSQALQEPVDF